jgi:endonuclease III
MSADTEITDVSPGSSRKTRQRQLVRAPRTKSGPVVFTARAAGAALKFLARESSRWNAPILTLIAAEEDDPFKTLIGCILSLRTKDQTTAVAAERLFALADDPERMLALEVERLEKAI